MNKLNKMKRKAEIKERAAEIAGSKKRLVKMFGARLIKAVTNKYPTKASIRDTYKQNVVYLVTNTKGIKKKINGTASKTKIAEMLIEKAKEEIGYNFFNRTEVETVCVKAKSYLNQKREQLHQIHKSAFLSEATPIFDIYAAGHGDLYVSFTKTDNASIHGGESESKLDWDNKYGGWAAKDWSFYFAVQKDWYNKIYKQNFFELDGMLTMAAEKLISDFKNIDVYYATWIRRGRGKSIHTERGFIAAFTHDGQRYTYHAGTYRKAVLGVQRKVKAAEHDAEADKVSGLTIAEFIKKYSGKDYSVTLNDAYSTGSCKPGVQAWVEASGLDFEKGSAHINEILEAFKVRPLPEVRYAVVKAFYRSKKAVKKAA